MSRREGGWSVQECALFFSVCDESAHCADAFTVYTPCVWVRTSGVCVITNSMCVCRGVEWGVVIRWVWSSATALRYVSCVGDDVAPARCAAMRDPPRVWRVGGATDYDLFFRAQGRMDNHCEWAMISYTAREKDETAPSTVQS